MENFYRFSNISNFFGFFCLSAVTALFFISCGSENPQPGIAMYIAPHNQSVSLECDAGTGGENVLYQWYESENTTASSGRALPDATDYTFTTPVFTDRGIHYYYCTATTEKNGVSVSKISSVAYTGLPTVYIDTPESVEITSKDDWVEKAEFSIYGAEEKNWNLNKTKTSIKGRGNSTWQRPKKPYSIKLDQKQKIFGMPEHKRWILLANYLDPSFMRNETAFYLSRTFEMEWTASGQFVDLVLNGEYKGLYWLGEAVKVDKNRVNINDGKDEMSDSEDKDYLIEMDEYFDENIKFKSEIKNLPYMVKNDDWMVDRDGNITSGGMARLERLQARISDLEKLLYPEPDESYSKTLDITSWAKFWLVNEIMNNHELEKPKSAFFTFDSAKNVLKAGPVWDFDWRFKDSYQGDLRKALYYDALFKSSLFIAAIKQIWDKYQNVIDIDTIIESMRGKISVAAEYDSLLWGIRENNMNRIKTKDFNSNVDFLKETLLKRLLLVDSEINNL